MSINFNDIFQTVDDKDKKQLELIKTRMTEKMKYAKSLPSKEMFMRQLALGYIELYKSLGLDE